MLMWLHSFCAGHLPVAVKRAVILDDDYKTLAKLIIFVDVEAAKQTLQALAFKTPESHVASYVWGTTIKHL